MYEIIWRGLAIQYDRRSITERCSQGIEFSQIVSQFRICQKAGIVFGSLGVGVTVECELEVTADFVGTVVNTASVTSDQNDPIPADNSDNASVEVMADGGDIFADGFESGNTGAWTLSVP